MGNERVGAHRRDGHDRARVILAVVALLATGLGVVTGGPVADAAACPLALKLRDSTVNQGLGNRGYARLARGKATLVRLFLSLPSDAPSDASIAVTGASLSVSNGAATQTISPFSPAPGAAPYVSKYSTAPALDSAADPKFVVPPSLLTPAGNANRFNLTLTPTVNALVKTSSSATPVTCSAPLPAFTAAVERRTNALRILVVPMGDARQSYASQFPGTAQATMQNALTTLARMFPVPDGIGDLRGAADTGGVRYSVNPTLLDTSAIDPATGTRPLLDPATGKFCGTASNFNFLKGKLSQFLQSWNTLNATVPSATADRVMGVVDETVSLGAAGHPCAEGYAALGGNQSWARLSAGTPSFPSISGSVMAMETAHTMGVVPPATLDNRQDRFSPGHSKNTAADTTDPNRAYNVTSRSFITDNRTAMKVASTSWNDTKTVFEPGDWADLQCKLGAPTIATECTTSGTVGTVQGVGANPTFVLSGDTDGTVAGTHVVESYFSLGTARSPEFDDTSPYRLVQRDSSGAILPAPNGNVGIVVTNMVSNHCEPNSCTSAGPPPTLFSVAVASDSVTAAQTIELWKGSPGAPGSLKLYTRSRGATPVLNTVTVLPSGGATQRASVADNGGQANGDSFFEGLSVSADGRYVAFQSRASNLVAGDGNNDYDVFVRDREFPGKTIRMSVDTGGGDPNGPSMFPSISANGRFVAFQSDASNLISSDTNGATDIFVRDRDTDQDGIFDESGAVSTQRVSRNSTNGQTVGASLRPRISADGRFVVFQSDDPNIVANDTNGATDIFIRDRSVATNTNRRVSVPDPSTGLSEANGDSVFADISGDGHFVAFESDAPDLVSGDTNASTDVFVRNTVSNTTGRVSRNSAGVEGNNDSHDAAISDDGNRVAFASNATNLVASDTNNAQDVFVRDRAFGNTQRVSVDSQGNPSAGGVPFAIGLSGVDISGDGSSVAFWSTAGDLVPGPTNGFAQIYVHDLDTATDATRRASVDNLGVEGNSDSRNPALTADGRFAVFNSSATNLAPGDTNGVPDVVVNNRQPPPDDGQQPVSVTTTAATAAQAANLRVDLALRCPDGTAYPVDVGLPPAGVADKVAAFEANFDPTIACGGGSLSAVVNDGFLQGAPAPVSAVVAPTEAILKSPSAAILAPAGDTIGQFDSIALRGAGKDADNGELTGSALAWTQAPFDGTCAAACTGDSVDLLPPPGGWTPGNHVVTLQVTDLNSATATALATFNVRLDCRQRLCSNGNPAAPGVLHPVNISKAVSLVLSSPNPCMRNFSGPACTTPSIVTVSAPAFNGDPSKAVEVVLCNGQALAGPNGDGSGGDGDPLGGCDFGNGLGFGALQPPFTPVSGSGSVTLDASGNLPGSIGLQLPSGNTLTAYNGSPSTNPHAVCPPTSAQIAAGWTCVVYVAELDTSDPNAPPLAAGFRQAFVKPPTPAVTCGGGACPGTIPPGTSVAVTGAQFPCKTLQPDDPTTVAYDAACATPWGLSGDFTILLKKSTTGQITPVTPTTVSSAVDGNYTITFTMPAAPSGAGAYKLVPHAGTCSLPCESGNNNAAGVLVNL